MGKKGVQSDNYIGIFHFWYKDSAILTIKEEMFSSVVLSLPTHLHYQSQLPCFVLVMLYIKQIETHASKDHATMQNEVLCPKLRSQSVSLYSSTVYLCISCSYVLKASILMGKSIKTLDHLDI